MNLYDAHTQWASRPSDERYSSLAELHAAVKARDDASRDGRIDSGVLRPAIEDGKLLLRGLTNEAKLTHWSSTQLLSKLRIPRELLNLVEPRVAEQVIADRLPKSIAEGKLDRRQRVLLDTNERVLRAFHGDVYERLWDSEVTRVLLDNLPSGWRNPVAFAGGRWGAPLVPSGLYAGDRDMFAILVDGGDWQDKPVGTFDVDGDSFNRGIIVWNSETGSKTFGFMSFMFRVICGNNIIWGASDVNVTRAAHRGGARNVLYGLRRYLDAVARASTPDDFASAVRQANEEIAVRITRERETTLTAANQKFKGLATQTQIADALDAILLEEKGATGTRWDWLQGFTSVARKMKNADDRNDLEVKASALLLK